MRFKYPLKKSLLAFIILLLLSDFLIFTTLGLRTTLWVWKQTLPGTLTIQGVSGHWWEASIQKLRYDTHRHRLVFRNVRWKIKSLSLLKRKLVLSHFDFDVLHWKTRRHDLKKHKPFTLTTPITIIAEKMHLDTLIINHLHFYNIDLDAQLAHSTLSTHQAQLQFFHLNWTGNGTIAFIPPYAVSVHTLIHQPLLQGTGLLTAEGNLRQLPVLLTQATLLGGTLQGQGLLSWHHGFHWHAHWKASQANPGIAWSAWPGNIQLTLNSSGDWSYQTKTLRLELPSLKGELRHQALQTSAAFSRENNRYFGKIPLVTLGKSSLSGSFNIDELWQADWRVNIPDLSTLFPNFHGAVNSHGSLLKSIKSIPQLQSQLSITHAAYKSRPIKDFSTQVHHSVPIHFDKKQKTFFLPISCWESSPQSLCIKGAWKSLNNWSSNIEGKNLPLSTFAWLLPEGSELSGLLSFHTSFEHLNSPNLQSHIDTEITPGHFRYQRGEYHVMWPWQQFLLTSNMDQDGFTLSAKAMHHHTTPFLLTLQLPEWRRISFPEETQPLQGLLQITSQDFDLLPLFIPAVTESTGKLHVDLSINGTVGKTVLQGNAQLHQGKATVPELGVIWSPIEGSLNAAHGQISSLLTARSNGGGTLSLKGYKTPMDPHFLMTISGKNVLLSNALPLKITTTPSLQIIFDGRKILVTGKIFIPHALLQPADFAHNVSLPSDTVFIDSYKEKPAIINPWEISSRVQLELGDAISVETQNIKAQLKGHLRIETSPDQESKAYGELDLLQGEYTAYGQFLKMEQGSLIFAGDSLTNPGLNLKAVRSIRVFSTTNLFQNSSSVSINNTASAIGPSFNTGFNSSLPYSSNFQKFVVGIDVQGSLKEPQMSLFSDPPTLSQGDILSYLLTGQAISQLNQNQGQSLLQAATLLDSSGGQVGEITQQVKQSFELDELTFSSGQEVDPNNRSTVAQNTSLVLGKYLLPKLYVNYSIGLLQNVNTLSLQYQLSKHWSVQGSTNALGSGVDLFYTINRH